MDSLDQSGKSASSRTALDTLAWLIEDAFEGDPSHSLLANLHDLRDEDWTVLPPGSGRSIADIIEHVAWAKWMYEDYGFGPATMRGDQPPLVPADGDRSLPMTNYSNGSAMVINVGLRPSALCATTPNWIVNGSPIGVTDCLPA